MAARSVDPPFEFAGKPGVLWLDDLDRYLDVIDLDELERFGGTAGVTVVATLRIDQYESLLTSGGERGVIGRQILSRARGIELAPTLSASERDAFIELHGNVDASEGVGKAFAHSGRGAYEPQRVSVPSPAPRAPRQLNWRDPLLFGFGGSAAALALAVAALIVTGGFTSHPTTFPERLEKRSEADARDRDITDRSKPLDLHGQGAASSYLREYAATDGRPTELAIYDRAHDKPVRRLKFSPVDDHGRPYRFEYRGSFDVDGDGAQEVIGEFVRLEDSDAPVVPVVISWDFRQKKYSLEPPISRPDITTAPAQARERYRVPVHLRDADSRRRQPQFSGYGVGEFKVNQLKGRNRFIAGFYLDEPSAPPTPLEVQAWAFRTDAGAAQLSTHCDTAHPVTLRPTKTRSLARQILVRWSQVDARASCEGAS